MTGPKFRKPPGYRPAAQTRASGPTQEQTSHLPGRAIARLARWARLSHSLVPRTGVLFWDISHPPYGALPSTPALPRDKLRGFWSTEGGLYARGGQ